MEKILIVEESVEFQKLMSRILSTYGITIASSAEEASELVYKDKFDLILLDITLPDRSGYSFLFELQSNEKTRDIPIICVSGKTDITDKITAFSLGADDYLVKPFDPLELKARVDSKIGKSRRVKNVETMLVGNIKIDLNLHRVYLESAPSKFEEVELTQTEFKILSYLCKRVGQVYTRDQLLVAVWGDNAKVLDRAVDVHVCSLRKKLKHYSGYIRAVPGVGYAISLDQAKKAA